MIDFKNTEKYEKCNICSNLSNKLVTDKLRRGQGEVYFCEKCEYAFLKQQNINYKEYYANEYRDVYSHHAEIKKTNAKEIFNIYKNFQADRLDILKPYLKKNKKLLEVGASAGQFLYYLKNKIDTIHALELDRQCLSFLKEYHNIISDGEFLENSIFKNNEYDLICAFQVLEHVEDPKLFLKNLKKVCLPGGFIFIEIPNLFDPLISIWDINEYKNFFYHSAHLHYFSEASLKKIVVQSGFDLKNVQFKFLQDYNLLNHLNWITNMKPQDDCIVGLSNINIQGKDKVISDWMNKELKKLNDRYIKKIKNKKLTSNIMMILKND